MASSADKVFAITEILEQILIDCELKTRELFLVQTVNRSFHHAVNGSTHLLRIMEILHKPTDQKRYRIVNPILWTEQLDLQTHYRTIVLSPASPRNAGTGWKVNVEVIINVDHDSTSIGAESRVGVKSNKFFINPLDGSWRRMKITRFPVVIEVPIRINYADVTYEDTAIDATGEMTLGVLAELIENVRRRSDEEHRRRFAEYLSATQKDNDEEHAEVTGCHIS